MLIFHRKIYGLTEQIISHRQGDMEHRCCKSKEFLVIQIMKVNFHPRTPVAVENGVVTLNVHFEREIKVNTLHCFCSFKERSM